MSYSPFYYGGYDYPEEFFFEKKTWAEWKKEQIDNRVAKNPWVWVAGAAVTGAFAAPAILSILSSVTNSAQATIKSAQSGNEKKEDFTSGAMRRRRNRRRNRRGRY